MLLSSFDVILTCPSGLKAAIEGHYFIVNIVLPRSEAFEVVGVD